MSNILIYLLLLLLALAIGITWYRIQPNRRVFFNNCGPIIERLQHEMSLVTLRVPICDVVDSQLRSRWGTTRVSLLVKGDVEIGVDCTNAKVHRLGSAEQSFTVYLPMPCVRRPRLDHERLVIHSIRRSWFAPPAAEAVNSALKEAQRLIEHAAGADDLIDEARLRASHQVTQFFREIGCVASVIWLNDPRTAASETWCEGEAELHEAISSHSGVMENGSRSFAA